MVVRVNGLLAAHFATRKLDGAIRDDLVDVHVRLRSGARLPNDQREVIVELPLDDLVGRAYDQVADVLFEVVELVLVSAAAFLRIPNA